MLGTNGTSRSEETPVSDVNGNGDTNGQSEAKAAPPVHMISVIVQKDTYIQASIWERTVQTAGGSFTTHEVSVRKRYKKNGGDEWASAHSFRCSECYAVQYVIRKAEEWILDERSKNAAP